jgi:hypothetical protein
MLLNHRYCLILFLVKYSDDKWTSHDQPYDNTTPPMKVKPCTYIYRKKYSPNHADRMVPTTPIYIRENILAQQL